MSLNSQNIDKTTTNIDEESQESQTKNSSSCKTLTTAL